MNSQEMKNAFLSLQIEEMVNKIKDVCPLLFFVPTVTTQVLSIPVSSHMKWDLEILSQCRPTCKTRHVVEGSKAVLIPCCSHIPPLSPLVYLSLRNTWNPLILLALSSLHSHQRSTYRLRNNKQIYNAFSLPDAMIDFSFISISKAENKDVTKRGQNWASWVGRLLDLYWKWTKEPREGGFSSSPILVQSGNLLLLLLLLSWCVKG